jgi:hypothetical protein
VVTKNFLMIVLLSGLAGASLVSRVEAYPISPERAAALQKCNEQADRLYHDYVDSGGYGRERNEWYSACMAEAGQEP